MRMFLFLVNVELALVSMGILGLAVHHGNLGLGIASGGALAILGASHRLDRPRAHRAPARAPRPAQSAAQGRERAQGVTA